MLARKREEHTVRREESELGEFLRTSKIMMKVTGTWPPNGETLLYRLLNMISMLLLCGLILTTVTELIINHKNIEDISFGLSFSMAALQTLFRHLVLFSKIFGFSEILQSLNRDCFKSHEEQLDVYLTKKVRICTKLRTLLIGFSLMTMALLAATPVINKGFGHILPIPFPFDMNDYSLILYIIVWCLQVMAVSIIAWGLPCLDILIFALLIVAAGQLQILRKKITSATDLIKEDSNYCDGAINEFCKKCIMHHVAITSYVKSLEETFSSAFLIQLLASSVLTCLIGFNFILVPVTSVQFARSFFFFVAVMMEFVLFCVAGNELMLQSSKVRDACYMTDWQYGSPTLRKVLILIMERSKRPLVVTAGKFINLNLESLLLVSKTTFSYFTVLWRLYSNTK